MNVYDARHQFIEGLERYIAGIESDERLLRLSENVGGYRDELPPEAWELVAAIVSAKRQPTGTYADAAQAMREHIGNGRAQRAA
jgi:hypothetical protein